jgi:lipoprotein-anchoring transpeptidase ErfK/SrfK
MHGTVAPQSTGTGASSGCIRMFNEDAMDLYRRCPITSSIARPSSRMAEV